MKCIPVYFLFCFWLNTTAALIVQPCGISTFDPLIRYDESFMFFDEWNVFGGCR